MLFNSYTFLAIFLPVVLLGWWTLRSDRLRLVFLLGASYVFYGSWDVRFIPVLVVVTLLNFGGGWAIGGSASERRRRLWLAATVVVDLGILVTLKYLGWLLKSAHDVLVTIGVQRDLPTLDILFPLGVSFYVLNAMSYAIDVFRGRQEPARDLLRFASFVAMFPHLIAGPIVRYSEVIGQLGKLKPRLTSSLAYRGMLLLTIGLTKKVLIADALAPHVDRLFAASPSLGAAAAWSAAFGYTLQLYFDFSAYSDMAIGLALLLGIRFPQNFDSPLQARNISDFWRRWHMTLSRFLRDYVYIPLGGSRGSRRRTAFNLGLTMLVAGLWHGAGLTFVVWGVYHGVMLATHATLRARGLTAASAVLGRVITTLVVVVGFVIFRAPDLHVAGEVLRAMAGLHDGLGTLPETQLVLWIVVLLVFVNVAPNAWQLNDRLVARPALAVGAGLALALTLASLSHPSTFLYFRF